jgi:LytR cell envelope-related transcriptional attenuator
MPSDATRGVSRRRSPARATVMIVGAVILGAIALVVALTALKGGGSSRSAATTATTAVHVHHARTPPQRTRHSEAPAVASPAETHVAVLNGTTTTGLAHSLSASLQESGFTRATPLDGTPPGSYQTTVVEYSSGHHAEAIAVAHALGVSELQPLEPSVGSLAGGSPVVVIAGLDKANAGGGESSGESSSGGGATP